MERHKTDHYWEGGDPQIDCSMGDHLHKEQEREGAAAPHNGIFSHLSKKNGVHPLASKVHTTYNMMS